MKQSERITNSSAMIQYLPTNLCSKPPNARSRVHLHQPPNSYNHNASTTTHAVQAHIGQCSYAWIRIITRDSKANSRCLPRRAIPSSNCCHVRYLKTDNSQTLELAQIRHISTESQKSLIRSGVPRRYDDRDERRILREVRLYPKKTYNILISDLDPYSSRTTLQTILSQYNIQK
jgi:hypothetical protein